MDPRFPQCMNTHAQNCVRQLSTLLAETAEPTLQQQQATRDTKYREPQQVRVPHQPGEVYVEREDMLLPRTESFSVPQVKVPNLYEPLEITLFYSTVIFLVKLEYFCLQLTLEPVFRDVSLSTPTLTFFQMQSRPLDVINVQDRLKMALNG